MPALPNVASVLRVSITGTIGATSRFQNGFHLQYTGTAPTVAQLNTLAGTILTAYATNFTPLFSPVIVAKQCKLADLTAATAAEGEASTDHPGTRVGTGMTAQVAVAISWDINVRYRGGHPRTYLPAGVIADTSTTSVWAPAFITEVNNAATSFRTAMNALTSGANSFHMVTINYWTYGAQPPLLRPTPQPYTIEGNVVHPRVDTIRRRLGKEIP